ncbi:MAG: DUF368 domain-containing protein [Planctomycetota bacterium]
MRQTPNPSEADASAGDRPNLPAVAARGAVGGLFMGLANLVPGISGGTMLLAAGVYPRFITAIGEVTTLRFRRASLVVLAAVVGAALAAIVLLAGPVKTLVVEQRWAAYSLFIGLTLGGVPVVWRLITAGGRKATTAVWAAFVVGLIGMVALALWQSSGGGGGVERSGFVFMLLAGIAGASAMILPGVSGGYLLLVLGVYVPILSGIDAFKTGLAEGDVETLVSVGLAVVLPVGVGVLVGVAGVSNLLKWLLKRYELATLGLLLGLLVGAVAGLWPFQEPVAPTEGMTVKNQRVTQEDAGRWVYAESGEPLEEEDLPTAGFTPSVPQVAGAAGLLVLGLGTTLLIDRVGREKPRG